MYRKTSPPIRLLRGTLTALLPGCGYGGILLEYHISVRHKTEGLYIKLLIEIQTSSNLFTALHTFKCTNEKV